MSYSIKFNKSVTFSDHTGVFFVKNLINESYSDELVPDTNMLVDLPPNTDSSNGWIALAGTPTVTGGQLVLNTGDVASCASLGGGLNTGSTEYIFDIDVESIGTGGFGLLLGGADEQTFIPPLGKSTIRITPLNGNLSSDITIATFVANQSVTLNSFNLKMVIAGSEDQRIAATSSTVSPAQTIIYDTPAWTLPLIAGDTVHWIYDGTGNYEDFSVLSDEIIPSTTWADFAAISPNWNSQTDILPAGWALRNGPHDAANFVELTPDGMRFVSGGNDIGIELSGAFGNLGRTIQCEYVHSIKVTGNVRILGAVPADVFSLVSETFTVVVNNGAAPISFGRNNNPTDITLKSLSVKLVGEDLAAQTLKIRNCEDGDTVVSLSNTILTDISTGVRPFDSIDGLLYGFNNSGAILFTSTDSGDNWTQVQGITLGNPVGGSGNCRHIFATSDGEVLVLRDNNLVKSIGWGGGAPTWTVQVSLSTPTGATESQFKEWGLDFNGTHGILSEYHNVWGDITSPSNVWITEDGGVTWNIELSTGTGIFTDLAAHWHGGCVDGWNNRFYISMGHGAQADVYVRDFSNTTWYLVDSSEYRALGTGAPYTSETMLVASPRGVYLGTDAFPSGVLEITGNQPTNNQAAKVIYLDDEDTVMPWWMEAGSYHEASGAVLMGTKLTPNGVQQPRVFGSLRGVTTLLWEYPTDPGTKINVSIRSISELNDSRVIIVIQIGASFYSLTGEISTS